MCIFDIKQLNFKLMLIQKYVFKAQCSFDHSILVYSSIVGPFLRVTKGFLCNQNKTMISVISMTRAQICKIGVDPAKFNQSTRGPPTVGPRKFPRAKAEVQRLEMTEDPSSSRSGSRRTACFWVSAKVAVRVAAVPIPSRASPPSVRA